MSPPTARARKANTANACNAFFFMVIYLRYGLPHADDVQVPAAPACMASCARII